MHKLYLLHLFLVLAFLSLTTQVGDKPLFTLSVVQEADGLSVTTAEAVQGVVWDAYLYSGQRVMTSPPINGVRVKLSLRNAQQQPLPDGQYLYIARANLPTGEAEQSFGRLTLQAGKAELLDSQMELVAYETHYLTQQRIAFDSIGVRATNNHCAVRGGLFSLHQSVACFLSAVSFLSVQRIAGGEGGGQREEGKLWLSKCVHYTLQPAVKLAYCIAAHKVKLGEMTDSVYDARALAEMLRLRMQFLIRFRVPDAHQTRITD